MDYQPCDLCSSSKEYKPGPCFCDSCYGQLAAEKVLRGAETAGGATVRPAQADGVAFFWPFRLAVLRDPASISGSALGEVSACGGGSRWPEAILLRDVQQPAS
jgi:hypothetical protein